MPSSAQQFSAPHVSKTELTLYCMDRVSSCNIYVIQQDTQCFMIEFIHNTWWLDTFRTSMVHLQERLQDVCCKFGMCWNIHYVYMIVNNVYYIHSIPYS